ncbi:hypothetical protein Pmar_PMAR001639, partial [Perkinsus marinus ATCC 50983]
MTQVKLLPSDVRRPRQEQRPAEKNSGNIKLRPAAVTTVSTTPKGRHDKTSRNGSGAK